MPDTATRPPPARTATLTASQSDHLYRTWLDRVTEHVGEAVALTVGYLEHTDDTVTALEKDLTAIRLVPKAPLIRDHPSASPSWHALTARRYLTDAEYYYTSLRPALALRLLQSAADHARTALHAIGWTAAA